MISARTILLLMGIAGLFATVRAQQSSSTLDELLRGLREERDAPEQKAVEDEPAVPDFLRETSGQEPSADRPRATPPTDRTAPGERGAPSPPPEPGPGTPLPEFKEDELNPFLMSSLNEILQGRAPDSVRVHLTFPGSGLLTQEQVTLGAAIVQGLGLRTDLKPLLITYGPQLVPGRFNVLIGTTGQLGPVLGARLVREIGASGMCMIPMPNYEEEPVLVVTGADAKGINEAVLALGFVNMDLPSAQFVSIKRVLFPETPPYFGQPPVNPGATYSFADLKAVGAPIRPVRSGGIGVQVYFPADIFERPSAPVSASIHFSFGQSTRRTSDAILIRLNGTEIVRTPWGETQPSDFGGRLLNFSIPIGNFLSGRNLLEITTDSGGVSEFSLSPSATPASDLLVYDDSTIEIPNVSRGTRLPDLRKTSRTLYPFVGQPDGSEISFLLTDNREETVCAAWMVIAKLSQISNTFLYGSDVSFTYANPDRHLIVIGALSRIPNTLRERIPDANFSELGSSKDRDENAFAEDEREPTAIERFFTNLSNEFKKIEINEPGDEATGAPGTQAGSRSGSGSIGSRAVMTSFPSPETQSRWILVVTARTDDLLLERIRQLVRIPFWSQIDGYLFSWNDTPNSVRSFQPDKSFSEVSFQDTIVPVPLGYGVSLRVWYVIAGVVFIVFVLMTLLVLKHMDRTIARRRSE